MGGAIRAATIEVLDGEPDKQTDYISDPSIFTTYHQIAFSQS
jgi:hypothetical protein